MNWLARLEVDKETAKNERIWDSYGWHKKLWECFPGAPGAKRDFLTRIDALEGTFRIWLLAKRKPARPRWCPSGNFELNEVAPSFLSHRYYAFDLLANPVKAIVQRGSNGETLYKANGKRKSGKRVPIVELDELRAWLIRKSKAWCKDKNTGKDLPGGFQIVEDRPLEITAMVESYFRKKGQGAFHGGVQFRGILEVTDKERFAETYQCGIGGAKGFGFGLLLLAPVKI